MPDWIWPGCCWPLTQDPAGRRWSRRCSMAASWSWSARPSGRPLRSGASSRQRSAATAPYCSSPGTGRARRSGCASPPRSGRGSARGTGGCVSAAPRWWRTGAAAGHDRRLAGCGTWPGWCGDGRGGSGLPGTGEHGMSGDDRSRRVLAVRCPAWNPPSVVSRQADHLKVREFEQVVGAATQFCPRIEVLRPGLLAFAVRGPARYFSGEAELGRKVARAVTQLGYDCGAGIADGMFAALLASRDALLAAGDSAEPVRAEPVRAEPVRIVPPGGTPAFLAPRAVTVLGEPDLADLLVRLGIRTLGEFAAIPVAEAGNRFGAQGLLAHRIARGLDPRPLAASPPTADLTDQVEFD